MIDLIGVPIVIFAALLFVGTGAFTIGAAIADAIQRWWPQ